MRTFSVEKITKAVRQYAEEIEGFYPDEWVNNPLNIALINKNQDVALFENQINLPKTVCGHYFFFSRGRSAIEAAKEFLKEIFSEEYNVETIIGLTPEGHKAALWMNRQLGFKENGSVDTAIGPCKLVILTKNQWKDLTK